MSITRFIKCNDCLVKQKSARNIFSQSHYVTRSFYWYKNTTLLETNGDDAVEHEMDLQNLMFLFKNDVLLAFNLYFIAVSPLFVGIASLALQLTLLRHSVFIIVEYPLRRVISFHPFGHPIVWYPFALTWINMSRRFDGNSSLL